MTTVLVAEDFSNTRDLLVDILYDAGYDVIEAANGSIALEKAHSEKPDLILLDVSMPVMDGWEVLKRLKENADTRATPVVMLTRVDPAQGELAAWRLGSKHYIAKPFSDEHVKLAVRVALREAEESAADELPVAEEETSDDSERRSVIGTGNQPLDQIMGGGIALGSLTFIEGTQSTGKSVLCQHITYESLLDGHGVAYFTYESATKGLVAQMGSIGLQASDYLDSDQLKIYPINGPVLDDDPECDLNPERLVGSLAPELGRLSAEDNVIILDDITDLSSESDDRSIIRFFTSCKRLCDDGRTIIVATRPHAFDDKMHGRLRDLCDAYLSLRLENLGTKPGTMLEVRKANNMDLNRENRVSFEVEPGLGVRTMSFAQVRL